MPGVCEVTALSKPVCRPSACERVVYEQNHYRSDDGDNKAVEVKACNLTCTEKGKQPAPDNRPDNPENSVEDQTAARVIDDLVGDEAGN
jgi:hypothetical protein